MEDYVKSIKLVVLFNILILVFSCSQSSKNNSKMSVEELISSKGEPIAKQQNNIKPSALMYRYDDSVYQVEQGYVESKFRSPNEDEKHIQYWRHLLEGIEYSITEVESDAHTKSFKLITKESKLTILFDDKGQVQRIAESVEVENE